MKDHKASSAAASRREEALRLGKSASGATSEKESTTKIVDTFRGEEIELPAEWFQNEEEDIPVESGEAPARVESPTTVAIEAIISSSQSNNKKEYPCLSISRIIYEVADTLMTQRSSDGMVALEDVRRVLRSVCNGEGVMDRAFVAQEQTCRKNLYRRGDETTREKLFHRLMVRPIEPLLNGDPPMFPREFIRNYHSYIEAVLGDRLKRYESLTREMYQGLVLEHGHALTWDIFFNDQRLQLVLSRAITILLQEMETPVGQWAWTNSMTSSSMGRNAPSEQQATAVREALYWTSRALATETR